MPIGNRIGPNRGQVFVEALIWVFVLALIIFASASGLVGEYHEYRRVVSGFGGISSGH